MNNESPDNRSIKELWQGQPAEPVPVTLDRIRASAGKFSRSIARRNAREYIAAVLVVVFFGFQFARTPDPLFRLGFGLSIAGMLYVVGKLHAQGSARSVPAHLGLATCIGFQRAELERQRILLSSVWRWYLGPLVPGLAVLVLAVALGMPGHLALSLSTSALCAIVVTAVFAFVARLNRRAALRLQQQIDELDDLSRP
jgi:hypothetical protein